MMKKSIVFISLVLCGLIGSIYAYELKEIKSSDQLARFIYRMTTGNVQPEELLNGIKNGEKLKIHDYDVKIPVREIYGTIITERYGEDLRSRLFDHDKKYDVRAICAFRDSKDEVWRFQITVFEERQYKLMEQFLKRMITEGKNKKK